MFLLLVYCYSLFSYGFFSFFYEVRIKNMEGTGCGLLLVGKPEGKRPFRRPRRERVLNIKVVLREIGRSSVD
jgi:hypothetical protein